MDAESRMDTFSPRLAFTLSSRKIPGFLASKECTMCPTLRHGHTSMGHARRRGSLARGSLPGPPTRRYAVAGEVAPTDGLR